MQTPHAETDPDRLDDMQNREQAVYDKWKEGHLTDLFGHREFSPSNHDQLITTSFLEARPSLEMARHIGESGAGQIAYNDLVDKLEDKAIDIVLDSTKKGRSALIASLHLNNVNDVVISHNALFVASNEEEFADKNVILVNPLMSRIEMGGIAITQVISRSGRIVFGIPVDGAERHGMPDDVLQFRNRNAALELKRLFELGGVALHWAPTGTRAKTIELNGETVKVVPEVSEESAKMLVKRTPVAVGMPMDVKIRNLKAEVLEPRQLQRVEDVHRLMHDMTEVIAELTHERVVYGQPEGSEIIEEPKLEYDNGQPFWSSDSPIDIRSAPAAA